MKKMLRIVAWVFFSVLVLLLIAAILCLKPLDTLPYPLTQVYKLQMEAIEHLPSKDSLFITQHSALEVGWSKVNLLPPFTTPISIDAHRGGKHFETVRDSIYVRAFVFRNGNTKVAYVSAELLIIPLTVSAAFDTVLKSYGYDNNNIYFSATHTHSSLGGWHDSYVGKQFAGKYDERVPMHIIQCISQAIKEAEQNCSPASLGYAAIPTSRLVFNRLIPEAGQVDSLLRIVKIEKRSGEKAAIIAFTAHATVFHESMMQLSGDWPGLMMNELEQSGVVNLAAFSAGAVGSHGPYETSQNQDEEVRYMAQGVGKLVKENFEKIESRGDSLLHMLQMQLYLREPNLRITSNIALRPWLFRQLFGDSKVHIKIFSVGNLVFAGMPCDFSGELTAPLDSLAARKGKNLIITSFNGGYIGYVTHDSRYMLNKYETKTMGWFGPGTGAYLSQVLTGILEQ